MFVFFLGVENLFFSIIVLSTNQPFPWDSGGFAERRIPGKNGDGTVPLDCSHVHNLVLPFNAKCGRGRWVLFSRCSMEAQAQDYPQLLCPWPHVVHRAVAVGVGAGFAAGCAYVCVTRLNAAGKGGSNINHVQYVSRPILLV